MNKNWILSQESFDALLDWLDPQRDAAGIKYEEIRRRLIKIFSCRGCYEPEDLADETIDRVTRKLVDIQSDFKGNKASYFYGVANKIHLEYRRRRPMQPPLELFADFGDREQEFRCLEDCLDRLPSESRDLVLEYYSEERQAKIEHRRVLAERLGIGVNALRIRAFRIRASLQQCVEKCLEKTIG